MRNKTAKEILNKAHLDIVNQMGGNSKYPYFFSEAYATQAITAMKLYAEQEAKSFANWLAYEQPNGRTLDQLWEEYIKQLPMT